jgi:hypothetical protein
VLCREDTLVILAYHLPHRASKLLEVVKSYNTGSETNASKKEVAKTDFVAKAAHH